MRNSDNIHAREKEKKEKQSNPRETSRVGRWIEGLKSIDMYGLPIQLSFNGKYQH